MENLTGVKEGWRGETLVDCFKSWQFNPELKAFKALPLLVAWGIWLARNASIFG